MIAYGRIVNRKLGQASKDDNSNDNPWRLFDEKRVKNARVDAQKS